MRIPVALHGRYKDCNAYARRAVTRMIKGASMSAAFGERGWVDPANAPGLLVLHGPSPLLGGGVHFQMFLPLTAFERATATSAAAEQAMERVFDEALAEPWSLLSLCSNTNLMWTWPSHRQVPFLRALVGCWDEFTALGARYTNGSNQPEALWGLVHTVQGVFVRRGIPAGELDEAPSSSRLAELVARCA